MLKPEAKDVEIQQGEGRRERGEMMVKEDTPGWRVGLFVCWLLA